MVAVQKLVVFPRFIFWFIFLCLYRDDEVEVRQAVDDCAAAVGCAVGQLSAVTDVLLPVLRGEVGWVGESEKNLSQVV